MNNLRNAQDTQENAQSPVTMRVLSIALLFVIALFLLTSCGDPAGDANKIVNSGVQDVQTIVYYAEETVNVTSDMVHNTVVEGNGVFSCPNGCD